MICDDFVMLGTTVPEPTRKGDRIFVCSAGISAEQRCLLRVYPLARHGAPRRWNTYRVPLERNSRDSRPESWQIAGDRSPQAHERINEAFVPTERIVPDRQRAALLAPFRVHSIAEADRRRLSLAIIHPDAVELDFDHNPSSPDSPQLALFETGQDIPKAGARRFPFIPRLRFQDDCGEHHLMLRDWGCYEFMRKNEPDYYRPKMVDALHLRPSSCLFVGNMNNQRNAWLVISVLNGIREDPTLFDEALPSDRPRIGRRTRRRVFDRDGWKCRRCGRIDDLTVDHIIPHIRGGPSTLDNFQTLCGSCNSAKGDRVDGAA
jgi:hypothetical protein